MDFEQTIQFLLDSLKKDSIIAFFHQGYRDYTERTIHGMVNNINEAQSGMDVEVDENLIKDVEAVLLDSINFFVNENVTDEIAEFIFQYLQLAVNWNQLACDDRIDRAARSVYTLKDIKTSFLSLIEASRNLTRRIQDLEKRRPPYYELSSHYLRAIKKSLD